MTNSSATVVQEFGVVGSNAISLDPSTTTPVCESLNVLLASFQTLAIQYQKHHFVVEGAEFYQIHNFLQACFGEVQSHIHALGERLNGLGGVPVASLRRLVEFCCFEQESDGIYSCRAMLEHDLAAEQSVLAALRRYASQAESLGDRATRYLLEQILLETEERAYHITHFLAQDTLVIR